MAFTHTNAVRYRYSAGGSMNEKETSRSMTAGAELNVSESLTVALGTTTAQNITGFDIAPNLAKSVFLKAEGYPSGVVLYANGTGGTVMAHLNDGEPYVWTSGTTNFPPGQTNPIVDSTYLTVLPSGHGDASVRTVAIDVKVLYDPTP